MKCEEHYLFPQKVIRADVSDRFSNDEVNAMVKGIDEEIANGNYYQTPINIPKFQTYSDIFVRSEFSKLRETFIEACMHYVQSTFNMFRYPKTVIHHNTFAWGYKTNHTLAMGLDRGPFHNHIPATLSGVFYLRLPPDDDKCGTAFYDPVQSLKWNSDESIINPVELNWVIFPGWMYHSTVMTTSQHYRYVVAADISLGHNPALDRIAK